MTSSCAVVLCRYTEHMLKGCTKTEQQTARKQNVATLLEKAAAFDRQQASGAKLSSLLC